MDKTYWEVYVSVARAVEMAEAYLLLLGILHQSAVMVGDRTLSIESTDARQLRVRSVGGRREWAFMVGSELQDAVDRAGITANISVLKRES